MKTRGETSAKWEEVLTQKGDHKTVKKTGKNVCVKKIFFDSIFALCVSLYHVLLFNFQNDEKMNEVMNLAHTFLQNFCRGNPQNQVLLHKHLTLFLTPGVSI